MAMMTMMILALLGSLLLSVHEQCIGVFFFLLFLKTGMMLDLPSYYAALRVELHYHWHLLSNLF